MEDVLIKYEGVSICHNEYSILEDVSFELGRGDFIYLIGKVGSGKSSLLKTMYGEVDISSGKALVLGHDMASIKKKKLPYLRRKLGIVFQDFQLLTDRSVYDNLHFVLRATGWSNRVDIDDRIKTVLEEHGIETIIHNLNLEHPEMAVGVRVRIKEKDLPQALAIVEQIEKEWEKENGEEKREKPPILIPIDFSDQVAKSIDFGFEFARKHGTAVKFLYVYYTPMFTISSNSLTLSSLKITSGSFCS